MATKNRKKKRTWTQKEHIYLELSLQVVIKRTVPHSIAGYHEMVSFLWRDRERPQLKYFLSFLRPLNKSRSKQF